MEFAKIRATGIRAVTLKEDDELVFCALSSGSDNIVVATAKGQGIKFKEEEVRSMGRQAAGVIGIRLRKNDSVVGMEVVSAGKDLLVATETGYGKRLTSKTSELHTAEALVYVPFQQKAVMVQLLDWLWLKSTQMFC